MTEQSRAGVRDKKNLCKRAVARSGLPGYPGGRSSCVGGLTMRCKICDGPLKYFRILGDRACYQCNGCGLWVSRPLNKTTHDTEPEAALRR